MNDTNHATLRFFAAFIDFGPALKCLLLPHLLQAFLVDVFGRSRRPSPSSSESSLTSAPGATAMPHEEPAEHIGSCYLLPKNFKSTEGRMQTTIVSKRFQPIGQFSAVYLIAKPMPDFECDMRITYAQHWKAHWKGLDVGHRGMGNSFTREKQ